MPDNNLTVSLIQYSPTRENTDYNLSRLSELIQPLIGKTDLIALPEMFSTGFSMNVEYTDNANNHISALAWMRQQATLTGAVVTGSIAVSIDEHRYNRFYWTEPNGSGGHYDKHHLFGMSDEPKYFTAGMEQKRFHCAGWEIKPVICYELRFPAWCRNSADNPYDLLLCPASWPSVRSDAWLTLLKARALENQCYVVGINRVGMDENGLPHKGDSVVFGPKGETVVKLRDDTEEAVSVSLSLSELHHFRRKFPVLDDMDRFSFNF